MIFDKTSVIKLVKIGMTPSDKARSGDINLSLAAALDEFSMRVRSVGFIRSYEVTLTAADRTASLTGTDYDLRSIFALKLGSGSSQRVLTYRPPDEFLRDHDAPDAAAGYPTKFTQLESSSGGYPTIKFEFPLEVSEILKVYYYLDMTPDNLAVSRSIAAIAEGTKSHFYGKESDVGYRLHQSFKELCALSRSSDDFTPRVPVEFEISRQDKKVRRVVNTIRMSRK